MIGPEESIRTVAKLFGSIEEVQQLAGDASTRTYYRIRYKLGNTKIAMLMPKPGENEEMSFIETQHFLRGLKLPVPEIYHHSKKHGILILEDLGDEFLANISTSDPTNLKLAYADAIQILIELVKRTADLHSGCPAFSLAFDRKKLMFEMDFFVTHFIENFSGILLPNPVRQELYSFFEDLCGNLADQPRVFTHRDYHSRNIMIMNSRLYMIDFQDARMGPVQYDLASLLRDSYIELPEELITELLQFFYDNTEQQCEWSSFIHVFHLMSLQRNIKALGTFGYQTSVRRTDRYLSAIPRTGRYIEKTLQRLSEYSRFRPLLNDLIIQPSYERHVSTLI